MRRYRLIPHTADIGMMAYGETLAEAFGNAAYGMFAIMTDMRRVRELEPRRFEVRTKDLEGLLFDWLNHLLYYFDTEKLLFRRFEVTLEDAHLSAQCYGERFDPARHEIKLGIKSATYYMLKVDSKRNRVRVIFDV